MKHIARILLITIGLSACTIERQGTELKSTFHPPLTYATWKTEQYKTEAGLQICAVTSGYNGLSVISHKTADGSVNMLAKGEGKLTPGMNLQVNVNGNHYRTSQEYFSASESLRITQDLGVGDKAYLEWSETHGHQGKLHSTNILKLEGFKQQFEQCQKSLLSNHLRQKKK